MDLEATYLRKLRAAAQALVIAADGVASGDRVHLAWMALSDATDEELEGLFVALPPAKFPTSDLNRLVPTRHRNN
jgi:hypothetical protein